MVGAVAMIGAINATNDGDTLAQSTEGQDIVTGGELVVVPPNGSPAAVSDTDLTLFPLSGDDNLILSTGDATAADAPDDSESRSADNGAQNSNAGPGIFDQVTLRVDLQIPEGRNCLTLDYRLLTEEFDEFVGAEFNDAFLAEINESSFTLQSDGTVIAPNNFAVGPDGEPTTVKGSGTSTDNSLGTTYDGGSPILRATTPITPGAQSIFLTVYDAGDAIYDTTVLVDNIKARDVPASDCKVGSADTGKEQRLCAGEDPTIFAVNGRAKGTNGDDVILGTAEGDVINGRGGDDIICGAEGVDDIRGQGGNDVIRGNAGDDRLDGNGGDDKIQGNVGQDVIRGMAGNDRVEGNKMRDRVFGGKDGDAVNGGNAKDRLFGRRGNDNLRGGKGPDNLRGGPGFDNCRGGRGDDKRSGCESRG